MYAQIEDTDACYPIKSNQRRENNYRGIGLAIVNSFYKFPDYLREGVKQDKEILSQLFASLKLEFRPHYELTKDQIVTVLKETAQDPKLNSDSMIAIAFSSHGCEEGLLGVNIEDRSRHIHDPNYKNTEDCISPAEIQEIFNSENCKALAGKPKLFLLNGCRGKGVETIVQKERVGVTEKLSADGIQEAPDSEECLATTWSDFFTVHSCVPGKISMLSNIKGSLFFVEFSEAYAKYGHRRPIESIMPTVNRNLIKVCKTKRAQSAQCCTWESTCTQSLHIPPATLEPFRGVKPEPIRKVNSTGRLPDLPTPRIFKESKRVRNDTNPIPTTRQFPNNPMHPTTGPSPYNQIPLIHGVSHMSIVTNASEPFSSPCGLVVAKSGDIYVADSVHECIWIFSGRTLEKDQEIPSRRLFLPNHGLANCSGMCIKNDFLFVSCKNQIIKFSASSGEFLISKFTGVYITGLDIDERDKGALLYVCEQYTCGILVLDMDLNIAKPKLDLTTRINPTKARLLDIKVFSDAIYVLISGTQAAIQMFDTEGHHVTDIVSSEHLKESQFFTMNRKNRNVYAGDLATNELKAFNNEHVIWKQSVFRKDQDDLAKIKGIDLNANNEAVIACIFNTGCMIRRFPL